MGSVMSMQTATLIQPLTSSGASVSTVFMAMAFAVMNMTAGKLTCALRMLYVNLMSTTMPSSVTAPVAIQVCLVSRKVRLVSHQR